MFEEEITHPSFGMIGWSRVQGTFKDLYGSSIKHSNAITLKIHASYLGRELSRDWFHSRELLIEVDLSPNQFSDFITTPNMGDGVPCTVRYIKGVGHIDGKEIPMKRKQFEQEFKKDMRSIGTNFDDLEACIKDLKLSNKDKEILKSKIFEVRRIFDDHLPFAQKSFNEQLDNSVTEAKAEIEGFVDMKVRALGIAKLKELSSVALLEEKKDE